MKKYLLVVLLFSIKCGFCIPMIYSLHINGINTSLTEAQDNLDQLTSLQTSKTNLVKWRLLYNQTDGLWSDLSDVFHQKAQEQQAVSLDDYVEVYMKVNNLHYEPGSPDYEIVKAGIKDDFINDPQYSGHNLESIVTQLHQIIPDPKDSYILMIPHSQGNLYANQLYEYLLSNNEYTATQLRIFGIASPANKVAGYGDYVTSSNDLIVNGLRLIQDGVLPANYRAEVTTNDILGHNLINVYLSDDITKAAIKHGISNALDTLAHYLYAFSTTDYLKISDVKSYNLQSDLLASTIMKDKEVIYAHNQPQSESSFYYYFSTPQQPPVVLYPQLSGRYTVNLSTLDAFKTGMSQDASMSIPAGVIGQINLLNCFQDWSTLTKRICQKSVMDNTYGGTLGVVEFDYNPDDLELMKSISPELFTNIGLVAIEEFVIK